jgi:hypothetical protein
MPDCIWRAACAGIAADTTRFPAIPGATRPISPPAAAARTAAKPARSPAIRAGAIRASSCRTASAAHLRLRRLLRLQAARVCSSLACRTICREHTAATAARLSCSATGAARETYAIPAYLTARNARERKPAVPGATSANSTSSRKKRSATFRAETIELLPQDRLKRFRICRRISAPWRRAWQRLRPAVRCFTELQLGIGNVSAKMLSSSAPRSWARSRDEARNILALT